jgi:type I restriction enzyme S subunit
VFEVPEELDGANLTQGTARIAPKPELNSRFVLRALRNDDAQRQFTREAKGTTFPEITLTDLRQLKIALPGYRHEQDAIVTCIDAQEAELAVEEAGLAKLVHAKTGLMTDLLTGRVRVPIDIGG